MKAWILVHSRTNAAAGQQPSRIVGQEDRRSDGPSGRDASPG